MYISPPVPSPDVTVSPPTQSELVSGSPLSLTCSIQPRGGSSVDTPTTVRSSWNAPNDIHDGDNTPNDTSVYLTISSVETADSGAYICSAIVTDSSDSRYVVDSQPVTDTVNITVSKSLYREWEEVDVRSGQYVNIFSDLLLFHRIECHYQCRLHCSSWGRPWGIGS